MKYLSLGALVATPLLMAGPMVLQSPQGTDEALKAELAAQVQRIDDLERDIAEARDLVDLMLLHMDDQAKAAKALETTLASSEQLGFTAGINSRSREVLLTGWRSYLTEQQAGVPKAKPKPVAKPK
ncbi:MAG: hypothetical protein P1V81_09375 [Planctomycetota bacterium]|nr:hypothetical protein [Planctomycetota bacterium]